MNSPFSCLKVVKNTEHSKVKKYDTEKLNKSTSVAFSAN